MTPVQWLVLDNLRNGWPYDTNLSDVDADKAIGWATMKQYVKDGKITDSGKAVLIGVVVEKEKRHASGTH